MKDWLVAHRGAQKNARENTIKAYIAAANQPISFLELDVHTTKDGKVICHHDFDVDGLDINLSTFKQLKKADPELITFEEAVQAIGNTALIVEIKPTGTAKNLLKLLNDNPGWRVASFKIEVIKELIDLGIDKKRMYFLQHYHSFWLVRKARKLGIGGIGVNQRLMTPRLYRRAMYSNLNIYSYVVNSPVQAKLFRLLYPKLLMCTDRPDILHNIK